MKRSLILVPIVLLIVLNACQTSEQMEIIVHQTDTAEAAATLTATNMPPTLTPTLTNVPNGMLIVSTLNAADFPDAGGPGGLSIQTKLDQLEKRIGADFQILDARFPKASNGLSLIFQIYAGCECSTNYPCCTREHMFVLTMSSLYLAVHQPNNLNFYFPTNMLEQLPPTIQQLQVICYDHQKQIGTMNMEWQYVQSFLYDGIDGNMLAMRVTPGP